MQLLDRTQRRIKHLKHLRQNSINGINLFKFPKISSSVLTTQITNYNFMIIRDAKTKNQKPQDLFKVLMFHKKIDHNLTKQLNLNLFKKKIKWKVQKLEIHCVCFKKFFLILK